MFGYLATLLNLQEQAEGTSGPAESASADGGAAMDLSSDPPPAPDYELGSYFFPKQASVFASDVDFLYYAIFWISAFFFVLIVALMILFAIKYRRRPGHEKALPSTSHNTPLEILWSVIPSIILVWIFVTGARGFFEMRVVPEAAEEIWVTAQQFSWNFTYPDGDVSKELHLVDKQPVRFTMESRDVLHSFFIPAFRQKQDVVPGRYTHVWVLPTKTGTFRLYCSEYCGNEHSQMKTNVVVYATEEERKAATRWIEKDHTPEENGLRLYSIYCSGCHKVDGTVATGPALNGIYGKQEQTLQGTVTVDENYIKTSIMAPNAHIVSGFTSPSQMQSFEGRLTETQIMYLIKFIQSIKDQ